MAPGPWRALHKGATPKLSSSNPDLSLARGLGLEPRQSGNSRETPRVERDNSGAGFLGGCREHQVVRTHPLSRGLNVGPQPRMFQSYLLGVRNDLEHGQHGLQIFLPVGAVYAGGALYAAPQLSHGDRCKLDL